ncbi:hypothetical protein D9757_000104 [Collybiopsis confluens]|uniref:Uncharacterized protein n=1 Tax=Collybiopsis confluens TaxID=2823264 RepID=A0A8H5MHB0_9AGAR|nr:hypothetical protein D9757_000104 [Collybiopsis confluens]
MASHDELLGILQAHGENFLSSFSESTRANLKGKKRALIPESQEEDEEQSEWEGIASGSGSNTGIHFPASTIGQREPAFLSQSTKRTTMNSVQRKNTSTKAQPKAFMSSKISKLRDDTTRELNQSSTKDDAIERYNRQNDALLHNLVHTRLLSGSLNPELDLTPAQRRKALSGRVLELNGEAKLGRGERSVRTAEHNKASKRVREGLVQKQKERKANKLEESKNLGNYHPKLKRLFEDDSEGAKAKKRTRGLKMGVGDFRSGMLRLSRQEIDSVQGQKGKAC